MLVSGKMREEVCDSKKIVESHEGIIFVSSKIDEGTEVTIIYQTFYSHEDKVKMQNKPNILTIDDELAVGFSLTSILAETL